MKKKIRCYHFFKSVKKDTECINLKVSKTNNRRIILRPICAACKCKEYQSIKEQEAIGWLRKLGIKNPLSKTSLLGKSFL